MTKKRIAQLVLVVAALAVFSILSRRWPKDHTFRFVLGDAAPNVDELSVRYDEGAKESEPTRFAAFHYARGTAPRVVTHEARLADGDYAVEIEVASHRGALADQTTVQRKVTVEGSASITIDLSRELAQVAR